VRLSLIVFLLVPGTGLPALPEAGLPTRRARATVLWCARAAILWRARAARATAWPAQADRPADLPSPPARLTQVQHEARVCTNVFFLEDFLNFLALCSVFNTASSAASQIPLCRRLLVSNLGLLRRRHWQSAAQTTRLDLIKECKNVCLYLLWL
jgi:hypothetical protein